MYKQTFALLDGYLTQLQNLWQFEAFHQQDYPWRHSHPDLARFLDALDEPTVLQYRENPELLHSKLQVFVPALRAFEDPLFEVVTLSHAQQNIPFWLSTGIKGRKWSQIEAFAAQVDNQHPILEWCAGKGHLGRLIGWQQKVAVTSIEWQQTLCDRGAEEALKMQVEQRFQQADVLQGEADHCVDSDCHAVALHACGDLHLRLIELAKKYQPKQLTISPCCYHLTTDAVYRPRSLLGQQSLLRVGKQDLKLAVSKQATSGKRQSRLNEAEVLWRLAFDELQKQCLNSREYMPLASFPKAMLSGNFREFAQWVLIQKGLTFALPEDLQPFLARAQQRLHKVRRMELISQFFSRPLELWLVYDRALSLQDGGYQISLSRFCDDSITPRNLFIQAKLEE